MYPHTALSLSGDLFADASSFLKYGVTPIIIIIQPVQLLNLKNRQLGISKITKAQLAN